MDKEQTEKILQLWSISCKIHIWKTQFGFSDKNSLKQTQSKHRSLSSLQLPTSGNM